MNHVGALQIVTSLICILEVYTYLYRDFCSALLQELDHMHIYQVPWGLVAFLAYYVVLYADPESGELKISQALPYDQTSPTIVMVRSSLFSRRDSRLRAWAKFVHVNGRLSPDGLHLLLRIGDIALL